MPQRIYAHCATVPATFHFSLLYDGHSRAQRARGPPHQMSKPALDANTEGSENNLLTVSLSRSTHSQPMPSMSLLCPVPSETQHFPSPAVPQASAATCPQHFKVTIATIGIQHRLFPMICSREQHEQLNVGVTRPRTIQAQHVFLILKYIAKCTCLLVSRYASVAVNFYNKIRQQIFQQQGQELFDSA